MWLCLFIGFSIIFLNIFFDKIFPEQIFIGQLLMETQGYSLDNSFIIFRWEIVFKYFMFWGEIPGRTINPTLEIVRQK